MNIEKLSNKLLCAIKDEMIQEQADINNFHLDMHEQDKKFFLDFIRNNKISNEDIETLLNYCKSNNYLSFNHYYCIKLTQIGFEEAKRLNNNKFQIYSWLKKQAKEYLKPIIIAVIGGLVATLIAAMLIARDKIGG